MPPVEGGAENQSERLSVIIPAHDEASVIGRCLEAILGDARPGEFEVIVVANGCTDQTAAIARRVAPDAIVLDLPEPSKADALNAGDEAATVFPRAYVDADVEVDAQSLRTVGAALRGPAECAAPVAEYQLEDRPWLVRRFYDTFVRLPYQADDLVGGGFYALSAEGRARFDRFPDLTADDLYIRNLFPPEVRRAVPGAVFHVHPPRDLRSLLAIRRRAYRGKTEYESAGLTSAAEPTLEIDRLCREALRRPVSFVVFVAVSLIARLQLRLQRRTDAWERDDSSR